MKKILALLMACTIAAAFAAGCGTKTPDVTEQPTSTEQETTEEKTEKPTEKETKPTTEEPTTEEPTTEEPTTEEPTTAEPVTEAVTPSAYQVYIDVLNQIKSTDSYSSSMYLASLYDIDKDGTEELLISYVPDGFTFSGQVWTAQDGQAFCMVDGVTLNVMAGQGEGRMSIVENGGQDYFAVYRNFGETFSSTEKWEVYNISSSGYSKKYTLEIVSNHMNENGTYSDDPVSVQYLLDGSEISESEASAYQVNEKERIMPANTGDSFDDMIAELQSMG